MITAEEVRKQFEAQLGVDVVLPPGVWPYLVEKGWVTEVQDGTRTPASLVDEYWKLIDASGRRRTVLQSPQMLTAAQRRRASDRETVLAMLFGQQATNDPLVAAFRNAALPSGLLRGEDVEEWLRERAASDGEPTVWIGNVPVPSDYDIVRIPGTDRVFTIPVLTITPERSGQASSRMLVCSVPAKPPAAFVTAAGGTLESLRELSQVLARRFSWSPMQAALFVLTGETPKLSLIRVRTEPSSRIPACTRFIMEVDPTADPDHVAERYRQARRKLFGRRVRTLDLKHLKLAAFLAERAPTEQWDERLKSWNSSYEDKEQYRRQNIFKRECLKARDRLLMVDASFRRRTKKDQDRRGPGAKRRPTRPGKKDVGDKRR